MTLICWPNDFTILKMIDQASTFNAGLVAL